MRIESQSREKYSFQFILLVSLFFKTGRHSGIVQAKRGRDQSKEKDGNSLGFYAAGPIGRENNLLGRNKSEQRRSHDHTIREVLVFSKYSKASKPTHFHNR